MRVGIIGAGMAGLACADALAERGLQPMLFDKGRGVGGRMSTRRLPTPQGEVCFDYGAPFFSLSDPGFAAVASVWQAKGLAAPWPAGGADVWVGVPGMNALLQDMAQRHDVSFGCRVDGLVRDGHAAGAGWRMVTDKGVQGPFDAVVVAIPGEQAAAILSLHDFSMARAALAGGSHPCWAGLFAFGDRVPTNSDLLCDDGPIGWACRNNAKPGRGLGEGWVVQASAAWSKAHLEAPTEWVGAELLAGLGALAGGQLPEMLASHIHRWRYAVPKFRGTADMWNSALALGACGDWALGSCVESAWLSGTAMAGRLLA